MKDDHTPKEWAHEYCGKDRIKIFKASDNRRIATVEVKSYQMDEANARLIASAPDLLEIAKLFEDLTRHGNNPGSEDLMQLQNAIAKAEGRASK